MNTSIRALEEQYNVEFKGIIDSETGDFCLTITHKDGATFLVDDLRDVPKRLEYIRRKFR